MNCEDFKTIVNELAEGRPMDATARVTALAHVTICAECAARLSDAKGLSTRLRTATVAETEETPARVRESLLASFAEHHAEQTKIAASPQMLTPISKGTSWRTLGWWSAAAVAAAAAIILALMLPSLVRVAVPVAPTLTAGVKGVQPGPTETAATTKPLVPKTSEPEGKAVVAKNTLPLAKPAGRPSGRPALVRKTRRSDMTNSNENEALSKNTGNQYFPLTYLASATAMESGTIVRVQVSRASLISLGLPMNSERTSELVKADLVLGDDGVARAIRLVE